MPCNLISVSGFSGQRDAHSMVNFLEIMMRPLRRVSSSEDLVNLLSRCDVSNTILFFQCSVIIILKNNKTILKSCGIILC